MGDRHAEQHDQAGRHDDAMERLKSAVESLQPAPGREVLLVRLLSNAYATEDKFLLVDEKRRLMGVITAADALWDVLPEEWRREMPRRLREGSIAAAACQASASVASRCLPCVRALRALISATARWARRRRRSRERVSK